MRTRFKYVAPQESAVERNEQTMMIVFSYYNFPCLLDIFLNSLLKLQGCRPQLEARANQGSLESAVIQIISDVYVTHIYVYMWFMCICYMCICKCVWICTCIYMYMYMIVHAYDMCIMYMNIADWAKFEEAHQFANIECWRSWKLLKFVLMYPKHISSRQFDLLAKPFFKTMI